VNFIIAYPVGVRVTWLSAFLRKPFTFSEHWSVYHFKFHGASNGAQRAKKMFHHGIPVICVSRALANDIRDFSGNAALETHQVDNVVDAAAFDGPYQGPPHEGRFFTIALWRKPKRPEVLLGALAILLEQGRKVHLRLAGDGPDMDAIRLHVQQLRLQDHVTLLGRLEPAAIGMELRQAHALWHCSDHETFSVVCAEALCCGTPVFASSVGGIPGFVDDTNGTLIRTNDAAQWAKAIDQNWARTLAIDRRSLSARIAQRFSPTTVGQRYQSILEQVAARHDPSV
jgi:L-malate glycosyltransferase